MTYLHRKIDPYSAYRSCRDKDLEISRLKQTIWNMKQEKPRGNGGGGTYGQRNQGNDGHGSGGLGGRGAGGQVQFGLGQVYGGRAGIQTPRDKTYNDVNKTLCRYFQERLCCDRPDQCTRLHKCSAKNGGAKHLCRIILFTYIRHLNHLGQGI